VRSKLADLFIFLFVCGSFIETSNSLDTTLTGWLEHNELGRMWKNIAMLKHKLLSQNLCGGAEGKYEALQTG
jgi:hypothetical protein